MLESTTMEPYCVICGCSEDDCSGCVERTGGPCSWVGPELCSACAPIAKAIHALNDGDQANFVQKFDGPNLRGLIVIQSFNVHELAAKRAKSRCTTRSRVAGRSSRRRRGSR